MYVIIIFRIHIFVFFIIMFCVVSSSPKFALVKFNNNGYLSVIPVRQTAKKWLWKEMSSK